MRSTAIDGGPTERSTPIEAEASPAWNLWVWCILPGGLQDELEERADGSRFWECSTAEARRFRSALGRGLGGGCRSRIVSGGRRCRSGCGDGFHVDGWCGFAELVCVRELGWGIGASDFDLDRHAFVAGVDKRHVPSAGPDGYVFSVE
jgi:hypothetical protein